MKILLGLLVALNSWGSIPFWKAKPKVYHKIKTERLIVVSAVSENKKGMEGFRLTTAGHMKAPLEVTHKTLLDFSSYPQVVSYIKTTRYHEKKKLLFVHGAVMGYHVRLHLKIDIEKTKNGYKTNFECIRGSFKGMTGEIVEEAVGPSTTEISMVARFAAKKIPIPDILMKWGLEFAGQRAAGAMRQHIEGQVGGKKALIPKASRINIAARRNDK